MNGYFSFIPMFEGRMTRQMTPSKSIVAGEASFAVSLKQLSYGWPAIIQNRANMGIVHLQCALYLPRTTRAHGRNTLDVVVCKDIKGLTKTEQYKQDESHLLITEKQFSSSVNVGTDMVVSYGSTEKHMEEKIIHLQEIWHIVSGKVIQIPLDIRDDSLIHLKATAGSIERCEIYMVFESVGIHKDESQADWVQLQRSRRKRIPSSTSSIEYAGAGPCSSSAQDQPLQSGKEPNVGDMMPEDDGQKSHEPDQKNAKDSHRFVEKKIDHDGGELQNETFGTLLFIPPGALAEGTSEVIGLTNLTEKPESLTLRRNEMIVSYGYRCSPFGLQFLKPVELTIPHCAVLTDPAKVETALYLSDEHGKMVRQDSSHPCVARENTFQVPLKKSTDVCVTIVNNNSCVKDLAMLCLPYFPREMPSHRCPVLEVCFFKDIKGVEKLMKEYEEEMSIRQLSRGFELQPPELPDIIKVNWGLKDRCGESQVVLKSELNQVMEKLVIYFPIDFKDEPNDSLITLTFNGTPRTIFNARFHRKTETAGTSTPQFADGSPEKVKELTLRRMMKLADHLHPDHYVRLGILLGFKNAELSNILMMNQNDYCTAYSVMLYHWLLNTPHAERIERFEETLRDAQLKGLIDDLWKD